MPKKDFFQENTFIDNSEEKITITKEASIYSGKMPRIEAHGKSKNLPNKIFAIGRDKSNAVIIADPKVSKFHALVIFKDNACYIRDTQSKNGTYVNDTKLQAGKDVKLNNNDIIVVGNTKIKYHS